MHKTEEFQAESPECLVAHLRAWARHGIHFHWESAGRTPDPVLLRLEEEMPPALVAVVEAGVTTYRFAHRHPDRNLRGQRSREFLDPAALERILNSVLRLSDHAGCIALLRFAPVYPTEEMSAEMFLGKLVPFLDRLPRGCRYAVELRTPAYLLPQYLVCLRERNIAHVLHETPPAPALIDQVLTPGIFTADFSLLRITADPPGLAGETGVALREAIARCIDEKTELRIGIDVPGVCFTQWLSAMMMLLNPDLARLSPIRRRAA
jgi:hypothetical protein